MFPPNIEARLQGHGLLQICYQCIVDDYDAQRELYLHSTGFCWTIGRHARWCCLTFEKLLLPTFCHEALSLSLMSSCERLLPVLCLCLGAGPRRLPAIM